MKIIKFCSNWCYKCKLFSNKEKLNYDTDINIDLPSNKQLLVKYQISIIPTFIALSENGRVRGKLVNPSTLEDYFDWKERIEK